jgi:hypothetical protein
MMEPKVVLNVCGAQDAVGGGVLSYDRAIATVVPSLERRTVSSWTE